MNNYKSEYVTHDEHCEIVQRIQDLYPDEYLTAVEFTQLYEQFADLYIHDEI